MSGIQSLLIGGFLNFAGPITLFAFFFWLHSLWKIVGPFHLLVKPNWRVCGAALLGTVVVFLSTKINFKVLSDETNLLSVANMLAVFGKASNTEMWEFYYHTYHALDVSVPSRPILFPLMVALVHMVVGLKWWSPFVVNFISLFVLFALVIRWVDKEVPSRMLPKSAALLSLLMSPVLSIVATSAGYDLVSLTVGFVCLLLLFEYEKHREAAVLESLLFGLVCFASVRYETIVAIPFTAAGLYLLEGRSVFKKISSYALLAAVFMILPLFVQRWLTWGSFENPPDMPPFSPRHVLKYLPVFLEWFFVNGAGPYPVLLHWLGLGGLVVALKRMKGVGMIPLVFCGFLLLLLLSHHFGRADHPTQVRLFLPISFGLGLLALYWLKDLEPVVDARYLLMVFGVLCFHHREYALHDPLTSQLTMTREVRHIRDFMEVDTRPGDLWIYDRPGQLAALGYSAISWNRFKENTKAYLMNLNVALYNRILMIERVPYHYKTAEERIPFALEREGYRIKPLRSHELTPDEKLRISEVELLVNPSENPAKSEKKP
ncbi:MAG TPA: hypothetical protein VIH99_13305 [Bdellovibrionota bacterium]|jgi:hypothetical protein